MSQCAQPPAPTRAVAGGLTCSRLWRPTRNPAPLFVHLYQHLRRRSSARRPCHSRRCVASRGVPSTSAERPASKRIPRTLCAHRCAFEALRRQLDATNGGALLEGAGRREGRIYDAGEMRTGVDSEANSTQTERWGDGGRNVEKWVQICAREAHLRRAAVRVLIPARMLRLLLEFPTYTTAPAARTKGQ